MRTPNPGILFRISIFACAVMFLCYTACTKQRSVTNEATTESPTPVTQPVSPSTARSITVLNPGFESDKDNWGDPDLFSISTSDHHTGTKSAKCTSSGNKFEQAITVTANTNYILAAWILNKGTIGAKSGSTVLGSVSVNNANWTKTSVTFNSGSATSITIYGAYNGGTGRFDDFTLDDSASSATPPSAPSGLSATANASKITLAWTDNSNNETGFKLERKTGSGGTYAEIAGSIAANAITIGDSTGLSAGNTYFYRVRAYNAAGNSSYSNEVSASLLAAPAAPSALSATTASSSSINLSWTDNSSNETGFKLERKTGSGGTYAEIAGSIAANTVTYTNTGLTAGTTYFYRIRSYNAAGNSAYSNETSATTSTGGSLPANVLNLTNWKITLPIDANGNQTGNAAEVSQPALATYSIDPYFHNNADNTGVIFQANTGGSTTSGSGYPRSELREMTNNGASTASWSSTSGTHTMEIDQAITHLPVVKKHIVVGQIHDANDDVIVFRLEGTKLFMDHNGDDGTTLDNNYVLGTRFKVKFVVSGGKVMSYYNDVLKETYTKSFSGAYFKAGAYVQSSCKSGETPGPTESCSAYGEVVIYNVTVSHQ